MSGTSFFRSSTDLGGWCLDSVETRDGPAADSHGRINLDCLLIDIKKKALSA